MTLQQIWSQALTESHNVVGEFLRDSTQLTRCEKMSEMILSTLNGGGNLFACGNGGSHCDAMHFAEEFTGRYRKDRRPVGALALGNPSHVTCVSNDYGFDYIFSRELEGLARKGDFLYI